MIISLILDYLIEYYLLIRPYILFSLLVTIIYFYPNKKTFIFMIILSILYDLLFSKILFIELIKLYIIYYLIIYIKNKLNTNYFSYIFILIISIYTYIIINLLLLFSLNIKVNIFLILINSLYSLIFIFGNSIILFLIFNKIKHIIL